MEAERYVDGQKNGWMEKGEGGRTKIWKGVGGKAGGGGIDE